MRKLFLLSVGLLLITGILAAQDHNNTTEKVAKDVVVFTSDIMVGTTVLKAGEYRIVCDTKMVTFTRQFAGKDQEWADGLDPMTRAHVLGGNKALELPCKGQELADVRKTTEVQTTVDQKGVRHLDKLYLKGSNVEHIFK